MNKINILIIGVGYHARRIYLPFFKNEQDSFEVTLAAGVDLESQKDIIDKYLEKTSFPLNMSYISNSAADELDIDTKNLLDAIVLKEDIKGVIISTEPLCHLMYAKWALNSNLNILMDKPITTEENVSTEIYKSNKIKNDFDYLKELYLKQKLANPKLSFSLMAQRRFHPAYKLLRDLVGEVYNKTNCPITSIQAFHSDGQWRLPSEIVDQNYHPYNQGYGKASHSGYHAVDVITWLLSSTNKGSKKFDNVNIYSTAVRPNDFLNQINTDDYRKLFPDFDKYNKYSDLELQEKMEKYGEIDIFNNITFKQGNKVVTLASVNLVHNGFSQRNWVSAEGRDLYKGNGRVRHETYYIEQGPFQAISFISYQSKEIKAEQEKDPYRIGGEYHLDIHVFRNSMMFPGWKPYELFQLKDIYKSSMSGMSRGHQEDARREGIIDFIESLKKEKVSESDFLDHQMSTYILSGMYNSLAGQYAGLEPTVNIKL